jgi:hypothetical protein
MAFDFSDFLAIIGSSYLETKKIKTDDPIELFFTGFINANRMINEACEKDMEEYYKRKKRSFNWYQ